MKAKKIILSLVAGISFIGMLGSGYASYSSYNDSSYSNYGTYNNYPKGWTVVRYNYLNDYHRNLNNSYRTNTYQRTGQSNARHNHYRTINNYNYNLNNDRDVKHTHTYTHTHKLGSNTQHTDNYSTTIYNNLKYKYYNSNNYYDLYNKYY